MAAKVNCSICGKLTDPALDNCPHCGSPVEVGRAIAPAVAPPQGDSCPSCGTPVQDGDIVCVRCGVNLLTGHQVAQKHQEVAVPETNKAPFIVGGAVVTVLVIVGALAFVFLRDPVQGARQKARSGDVPGAIAMLQQYTDRVDDDVDAFAMLGRLYWQMQQFADASTAFETASRLRPGDEDLAYMSVIVAGKIPGAGGMSRQLAALKRMAENHPNSERAQKMAALAEGIAGEYSASESHLDSWSSLAGGSEEVAAYRGIVSAMRGDLEGARAALGDVAGEDENARLAQGYLASLEGEPERAAALLSETLDGSPGLDSAAASRLGLLHMAQGDFDKALPLLRPAQGDAPSENGRFFYALCLQTAGLGDDALMEYDRLVSGGGNFAKEGAIQMAIIYLARGQQEQAAEAIRKAKTFGTSPRLYTVEGQLAAFQGDFPGAQDAYRRAVQEDDGYPAAHLEQGLVFVRRGALAEGVRELERYIALSDASVAGGRINEVDLLVKQLQQTLEKGQG